MNEVFQASKNGRPTEYKPEYCEMLIAHCKQGLSFESFAGKLEISKKTLYNWAEKFPEFAESKSIAVELSRLFWEKLGIENIIKEVGPFGKSLNSAIYIFNMRNRFYQEWSDRHSTEKSIEPATINIAFDPAKLIKVNQ